MREKIIGRMGTPWGKRSKKAVILQDNNQKRPPKEKRDGGANGKEQ
jgi:hypothetical protein